jgi:glycosyltransferase involved in cell wall biosynthesis
MKYEISVVIPLYNKEYLIRKCLQSIVDQSTPPFEIVIIDDGSTDDSGIIVKEFIDRYEGLKIHFFYQENSGVSSARNLGIYKAESDYIALLDADDEWDKDFIFEMSKLINKCPEASMYSCFHRVKDGEGNLFTPRNSLQEGFSGYIDNYHQLASSGTELVNSSKVILKKESVLLVGGFPVEAVITEDLFLWSLMAIKFKYAFLSKDMVQINQYSDDSRAGRTNKTLYILEFYKLNLYEFRVLTKHQKGYLFNVHFKHVLGSLASGNRTEALQRLKVGSILFKLRNIKIWFLIIIPSPFFTLIKNLRRKILSRL